MTEKKWLCEVLHIAGLLNSENPIQIQIETFIKHVSPAKLMAIHFKVIHVNTCVSTRSRTRHPLYDNQ